MDINSQSDASTEDVCQFCLGGAQTSKLVSEAPRVNFYVGTFYRTRVPAKSSEVSKIVLVCSIVASSTCTLEQVPLSSGA